MSRQDDLERGQKCYDFLSRVLAGVLKGEVRRRTQEVAGYEHECPERDVSEDAVLAVGAMFTGGAVNAGLISCEVGNRINNKAMNAWHRELGHLLRQALREAGAIDEDGKFTDE